MKLGFDTAFEYLLQNEGATFTDDKVDKGGPTNFGITLPVYSKYLDREASVHDLEVIDEETAKDLYLKLFWNVLYCDLLPYPIAVTLFDTAVNKGQGVAIGFAQACLSGIKADGIMGEETLKALQATDPEIFIVNYIKALLGSQIDLCLHAPSQLKYLKGWANRACRLFLLVNQ